MNASPSCATCSQNPDLELADPETVCDPRAFEQRGTDIRGLLIDIVHGVAFGGAAPDLIATKRAINEWIEAGEALLGSRASH